MYALLNAKMLKFISEVYVNNFILCIKTFQFIFIFEAHFYIFMRLWEIH